MRSEIHTLKDLVEFGNDYHIDAPAFKERRITEKGYIEYTFKDLEEDVKDVATALVDHYNLRGKKVAVIGENSYEWMVSYLAVTTCSGIIMPLDKELPENEIANLLEQSKAEAIFYSTRKREAIEKIKSKLDNVKYYIEMYSEETEEPSELTYSHVKQTGRELRLGGSTTYEDTNIDDGEFRVLIYTSGTTAKAKGVMLSHRNILNNARGARTFVPLTTFDRLFSVLPMHHTYEMSGTYITGIFCGCCVCICQSLKQMSNNIEDYKPTMLVAVPLLLEKLYKKIEKGIAAQGKQKTVEKAVKVTNALSKVGINLKRVIFKDIHAKLGGSLKYVLSGSAPINPELIKKYEDLGIGIMQGFGLTEAAPVICGTSYFNRAIGTVGKAAYGMKLKLYNVNDEGVGEIIAKGPNVMLGYYENQKLTDETVIDGWLHTGDLAYKDKHGNYIVCGRSKDVIVTKNGKKIFPDELENLVNDIPEVKESLVYEKENEEDPTDPIVAVIVSLDEEYINEKYGKNVPTEEALQEKIWKDIKDLNRTMVPYKAIKNLKIKDGEFEKTTTLKIKRFLEVKKIKGED